MGVANGQADTSLTTPGVCPKCGAFKRSGRASCCAPGGAWFQSCGDANKGKFDHSWLEGVEACKSTTTTLSSVCLNCATIKKSGKVSCCARGGAWFGTCGGATGSAK